MAAVQAYGQQWRSRDTQLNRFSSGAAAIHAAEHPSPIKQLNREGKVNRRGAQAGPYRSRCGLLEKTELR